MTNEMSAWGLRFGDNLVQIAARILPGETVALGQGIKKVFISCYEYY